MSLQVEGCVITFLDSCASVLIHLDTVSCALQTAGLTLANRLTEDPSISVVVLEAGEPNVGDSKIVVPGQFGATFGDPKVRFRLNSSLVPMLWEWSADISTHHLPVRLVVSYHEAEVLKGQSLQLGAWEGIG